MYKLPFRFTTLFSWKKTLFIAWGIHGMLYASLVTLFRPVWSPFKTACIVTSIVAPTVGYLCTLLNMYNGGWGEQNSWFWCHFRVMYLSGYNAIRWPVSALADACFALSLPYDGAIWAASACVYLYYILASVEIEKSEVFTEELGYDLELQNIHELQLKRKKIVNANSVLACLLMFVIPMIGTGWSYTLLIYQIVLSINTYVYATRNTTFVMTDARFDIIHFVFRVILLWMF